MVSEWITSDLVSASCSKEVIDRPLSTGAGDLTPNGIERENPHWHAVDAAYRNLSGIPPVGHFQIIGVLNLDRRVAVTDRIDKARRQTVIADGEDVRIFAIGGLQPILVRLQSDQRPFQQITSCN